MTDLQILDTYGYTMCPARSEFPTFVDTTETIEKGKSVIVWRVDVVFLEKSDWKYEGSSAIAAAGGRTHTFGVRQRAKKLRGKAVYRRAGIVVRDGKPVPADSEH